MDKKLLDMKWYRNFPEIYSIFPSVHLFQMNFNNIVMRLLW